MAHTFEIAHPVQRRGRMSRTRRIRDDWAPGVTLAEVPELVEAPRQVARVWDRAVYAADGQAWVETSVDKSGAPSSLDAIADVLGDARFALTARFHGLHGYLHRSPISAPTGQAFPRGDARPTPVTYEPLWIDADRAERKVKAFVVDRLRIHDDVMYHRYELIPTIGGYDASRHQILESPRNGEAIGFPMPREMARDAIHTRLEARAHATIPPEILRGDDDLQWMANFLPSRLLPSLRPDVIRCTRPDLAAQANDLLPKLESLARDGMTLYVTEPDEILAALMVARDASGILAASYVRREGDARPASLGEFDSFWAMLDAHITERAIPRLATLDVEEADQDALIGLAP